jgi:hypothetical protein
MLKATAGESTYDVRWRRAACRPEREPGVGEPNATTGLLVGAGEQKR